MDLRLAHAFLVVGGKDVVEEIFSVSIALNSSLDGVDCVFHVLSALAGNSFGQEDLPDARHSEVD